MFDKQKPFIKLDGSSGLIINKIPAVIKPAIGTQPVAAPAAAPVTAATTAAAAAMKRSSYLFGAGGQ